MKFTLLIDKDSNSNKSVFSLGDCRHNVNTKEDADSYSANISQNPKKFNPWTNTEIYNPKFKRDVEQIKIDKFGLTKDEANRKIDLKLEKKERFKI